MSEKETAKGLTRRGFITGATAAAGAVSLTGLGAREAGSVTLSTVPRKWSYEADVVVVGYGIAGAATAIEAHDAGAKVLIVEKNPTPGGNTVLSGGVVYAAGTSVQRSLGIEDSADGMYKYWMARVEGLVEQEIIRVWAEKSSEQIEWLQKLGVKFPPELLYFSGLEPQFDSITPPRKRGHVAEGKGRGLFAPLKKAVEDRRIAVLLETPAKRLIDTAENEALGITAENGGKELYVKASRAVILASGGFARDKEYLMYFAAKPSVALSLLPVSALGLNGDGIRMAQALGAQIINMAKIEPSLPGLPTGPTTAALVSYATFCSVYPFIYVNKRAKRFVNESLHYKEVIPKVEAQEGSKAFVIFDDEVKKKAGGSIGSPAFSADLSREINAGIIKTGHTIREFATQLGLDSAVLEDTITAYNRNAELGKDPEFGKTKNLAGIKTPPFYGFEVRLTIVDTYGGLRTNLKCQVIDVFHNAIPRLYAAGAVDGNLGSIGASGGFLGLGVHCGRIAGRNAGAEMPWKG